LQALHEIWVVVRYLLAILSFLNCETVRLLVIQQVIDVQLPHN
jgi:hypothetical protein